MRNNPRYALHKPTKIDSTRIFWMFKEITLIREVLVKTRILEEARYRTFKLETISGLKRKMNITISLVCIYLRYFDRINGNVRVLFHDRANFHNPVNSLDQVASPLVRKLQREAISEDNARIGVI
jgi:hypothetical protein